MTGGAPTGGDAWLPPFVGFSASGGDWERYVDALYAVFRQDFVTTRPTTFRGLRWSVKKHPEYRNREATFWHLLSEGDMEDDRLPDLMRCERIRWPRAMIDAFGTARVVWWEQARGTKRRLIIALPDYSYVVVLNVRPDHIMLWTAFCVSQGQRRATYLREHQAWVRAQTAPTP